MSIYELAQKHLVTNWLPPNLNERLATGSDGEIYSLRLENPPKVLKLSIMFPDFMGQDLQEKHKKFHDLFCHLLERKPACCARVFSRQYLGAWKRDDGVEYIIHYHTMERLQEMSDDERRVFHTIMSHEDANIKKNYSPDKLQEILEGLSKGLDFDLKKVMSFHKTYRRSGINHNDLVPRNIMKDKRGNFKLIDFDRATLEK